MIVTYADYLRQEGREASLRELFVFIIEDKFGAISESAIAKVRAMNEKEAFDLGLILNRAKDFDELGLCV